MENDKITFVLRQASNGWILEVDKAGDNVEFIFNRDGAALSMMRKILKGEVDPFEEGEE